MIPTNTAMVHESLLLLQICYTILNAYYSVIHIFNLGAFIVL